MRHVPAIPYSRPALPTWRRLSAQSLCWIALRCSIAAMRLLGI